MKDEEFQGFTSFDFVTVIFSLVVVVAVSAPIIKKNFQSDNSMEVARHDLSLIPQAILGPQALKFMAASYAGGHESRSIASIPGSGESGEIPQVDMNSLQAHLKAGEWAGDVGRDPWGKPYHFQFLRNRNGMVTHLAVWSDGPNGKRESEISGQYESIVSPQDVKFDGDDVGAVTPVR